MKAENKYRWMIWAIAVLVVMNLTTLITVVYHKNQLSEKELVSIPNTAMSESASMKYSGRYFRDELGLNMEQMKKFSEFNPGFRHEVMAINRDLTEKKHEMLNEMSKKECDTNRLNLLSDSIGYLHANLKKQTYLYYMNFKNICNQEQQKKLEQMFAEMFASDVQVVQNGKGGPGGRRFGRRTNN